MEILTHAQFENTDYALSRIKSFKRRYKIYLQNANEQIVLDYIAFVEKIVLNPEIIKQNDFKKKLDNFIYSEHKGDVFLKSFLGWILAMQQNSTPYEATMRLIQ